MQIDREHVKEIFKKYTDAYDASDEKVKLKIDHTYRVADLCERIAKSEMLDTTDVELAWLLGMLHDIGRFEQLRRYGTFNDAESIDHAQFGADILFAEGRIRDYVTDDSEDKLIERAIRVHSMYRVPKDMPSRTAKLAHILRDADKIDILKVNVEVPIEEIYNVTTEELRSAEVSEAVMKSFYEHTAIRRDIRQTVADNIVGHISLVYELVFDESTRIAKAQGYLDKLMNFQSHNTRTMTQFAEIRAEMERYLAGRSESEQWMPEGACFMEK